MTRLAVMMMVGLVALMPLLSGCGIGYTRTFFAAKTNVGLEVSTTPPTVQLDISQLEGVVSPQFENGKKLPVMSSFRFDNIGLFSPAVGSAFATGDAAKTMAALFRDDTPPGKWTSRIKSLKDFPGDSTIILNKKPTVMSWVPSWLEWAKPKFQKREVRPVFFGTDTALGVKLAWSGMTGQFPDTAIFGYNRKEIALVPISMEKGKNSEGKDEYRMKQSSLLATLDSATNLSTDEDERGLNFQLIQYFATGDAANLLVLQKEVRQSMLARLDPNQESYKDRFAPDVEDETRRVAFILLQPLYSALKKESDPEATRLMASMDTLKPSGLSMDLKRRSYTKANGNLTITLLGQPGSYQPFSGRPFEDFHGYYLQVRAEIKVLEKAISHVGLSQINGTTIADLTKTREQLLLKVKLLNDKKVELEQVINSNGKLLNEVVRYFYH